MFRRRSTWRSLAAILMACVAIFLAILVPASSCAKGLRLVATTRDVAEPLRAVAGEACEVTTLAPGSMDPHYLEAKPSFIVSLRKADLLAYNGLQLEIGWLPLLLEGARNRKITWGAPGNVSMSQEIDVLEVPHGSLSRAEGDIHPEGNPHYTLDPRNLIIMARTAEEALARLDPENAALYARNREAFVQELQEAIAGWEARLAPYRGSEVVCYHKQFEYLLHWLGLLPVDYVENRPGIPPSPRHLDELERRMRERRVPLLLVSTYTAHVPMEQLAEATGAKLLVVPPSVGAEDGVETAFELFESLVSQFEAAMQEVQSQ